MISYREKQLIAVQKMLQDNSRMMLEQTCSLNKNNELNINLFRDIESYDELVELAIDNGYDTSLHVEDILTREELEEIDRRKEEIDESFKKQTGLLNPIDLSFLALATALQCVRQYCLTPFHERQDDQTAAKISGKDKEISDRKHKLYCPSLEEIIQSPVPFDANRGSNGALKGGGKLGHRATAIGHDPVVGLIVGTANIATSTLTTWDMKSYHIGTKDKRDYFSSNASTVKVLEYTRRKIFEEGKEGKEKVVCSLMKEITHLKSDIYSTRSLPFPIISTIDPKLSSNLADYGMDAGNLLDVGKQAGYAALINFMIGCLHRLCFSINNNSDEFKMDNKLYEVRTRKILLLSNLLASSSNLVYVALTHDAKKLDVGGILITITRLFSDVRFITKIKQEFIEDKINSKFEQELEKFGIVIARPSS